MKTLKIPFFENLEFAFTISTYLATGNTYVNQGISVLVRKDKENLVFPRENKGRKNKGKLGKPCFVR